MTSSNPKFGTFEIGGHLPPIWPPRETMALIGSIYDVLIWFTGIWPLLSQHFGIFKIGGYTGDKCPPRESAARLSPIKDFGFFFNWGSYQR